MGSKWLDQPSQSKSQAMHLQHHRKSVIGRAERNLAPAFQAQRLSDVGVAVGQQLTAKMGLKLPMSASHERIVEQSRVLYLKFLLDRLRKKSLPLRDLNLTKSLQARRAAALGQQQRQGQFSCSSSRVTQSAPSSAYPLAPEKSQTGGGGNPGMADCELDNSSSRSSSRAPSYVSSRGYSFAQRRGSNISFAVPPPVHLLNNTRAPALTPNTRQQLDSPLEQRLSSYSSSLCESPQETPYGSSPSFVTVDQQSSHQTAAPNRKSSFIMDPTINNQIFNVIMSIIRELRDQKPEFYDDTIYELIGIDKFASLQDLLEVQKTICQEMTRSEITWCRIVALFSLSSAMSLDCVRMGAPDYVGPLLDGFVGFVERDLAFWIAQQGGWESFLYRFRSGLSLGTLFSRVAILVVPLVCWAFVSAALGGGGTTKSSAPLASGQFSSAMVENNRLD